jgi:hypothetical protein
MAKTHPIPDLEAQAATATQHQRVLAQRRAEFMARAGAVRQAHDAAALHDLRIAGKRLRYALMAFAPCLPEQAQHATAPLEQLQDRLGQIRDLDVAVDLVRDETRAALRRLRAAGKRLTTMCASDVALSAAAASLADELRRGQAHGLLELLPRLAQHRRVLLAEFLLFWDEARRRLESALDELLGEPGTVP